MQDQPALVGPDQHELLFPAAHELRHGDPLHLFQGISEEPVRFFSALVGSEIIAVLEVAYLRCLRESFASCSLLNYGLQMREQDINPRELVMRLLVKVGLADKWRVLPSTYDLLNFVRIERLTDGLKAGVAISPQELALLPDEELTKRIRLAIASAVRQGS